MRPIPIPLVALALAVTLLLPIQEAGATVTTLPVQQLWQARDNSFIYCAVPEPPCPGYGPHPSNCAPMPPYGFGCKHCGAYCALASVMMVRNYRGFAGCPCTQDCLYDHAGPGEIRDYVLMSHGIGMTDADIINAFLVALDGVHSFSSGPSSPGVDPMTPWVLRQLICMGTPPVWVDRDGHPQDYMNPQVYSEMVARGCGHAKVLAGYDDNDTYCLTDDDRVLIYDPWPSPGECPYPKSPYWRPISEILSSAQDAFFADRVGGVRIQETLAPEASAWSNGRHLVRDESDGSYNVIYPSGGGIYFTKSLLPRDPSSWSAPVRVDDMMMVHWSTEPVLALTPNPNGYSPLHAVWVQMNDVGEPGDLFYSTSPDGGANWSMPVRVYSSPLEDSRRPSLDVDGRGTLHLVWDETGLEMGREILYSSLGIGGPSIWSPPENISRTPHLDSCFPTLATSYDGTEWDDPPRPAHTVHVAWVERAIGPIFHTVVYRWLDPTIGWTPPLIDHPEEVTGGIGGTSPSLIVGPDRVPKVVWTSSQETPGLVPQNAAEVYYNERPATGWGTPQMVTPVVSDNLAAITPTIALANGPYCTCLYVAYEQWSLGSHMSEIWVAMRSGMTMQWTAHTRVTYDGMGVPRHPSIAYKNGTDFTKGYDLIWNVPNPSFMYEIRFLGTSVGQPAAASAGQPPVAGIENLRAWPNPFRTLIEVVAPSPLYDRTLQVFDVTGRRVRDLAAPGTQPSWIWDGRDESGRPASNGVYFVRVEGEGRMVKRVMLAR